MDASERASAHPPSDSHARSVLVSDMAAAAREARASPGNHDESGDVATQPKTRTGRRWLVYALGVIALLVLILLVSIVAVAMKRRRTVSTSAIHPDTGAMYWRQAESPTVEGAAQWKYELDTMLGMSYFFYEVNRAGRLPAETRPPWRGDTLKNDNSRGASLDGDLEGGYFDAGDHMKFILPQAFAVARLNWLVHQFPTALEGTRFDGQPNLHWAREGAKWGADFLAKGTREDAVILNIGDVSTDHGFVGRAEFYPQVNRNVEWCPAGGCSDIAAAIASALAHAAVAFADEPEMSRGYWSKALQAYAQTGVSSSTFTTSSTTSLSLESYYTSSAPVAHSFFAAASLLMACTKLDGLCSESETEGYRQDALGLALMEDAEGGQKWFFEVPGWDNPWWDAAVLMSSLGEAGPTTPETGTEGYFKAALGRFAEAWLSGSTSVLISPLGQRFGGAWASNRYALHGAAVLLLWAALPEEMRAQQVSAASARCVAVKQIHYVAGDNDRGSYVVGFGSNPPTRMQHRNSACSPQEHLNNIDNGFCIRFFYDVRDPANTCAGGTADANGRCYPEADRPQPYVVHGALIGGPKTPTDAGPADKMPYNATGWNDWRTDWRGNEITLDYNAMYTLALAAAIELPESFWLEAPTTCTGDTDLQLDSTAGLARTPPSPGPGSRSQSFMHFQQQGFTRTLPSWIDTVP